jgi:aryl-alcohol dehydrogenase-like predicted oxidoreductase
MNARWDVNCGVEEVMRGLHALVMAKKVLYQGASDKMAWVVIKANACKIFNLLDNPNPDRETQVLARTASPRSRSTKAVGIPRFATSNPRSSLCAKTREWLLLCGLRLAEAS